MKGFFSPWAFATADAFSFEVDGDRVRPGVRRPDRLQRPAKNKNKIQKQP